MKTIVKLLIVAVIVLGAQSSHAVNPHPSVSIRVLDSKSFAFQIGHIENRKIKVSLLDGAGHILFSRQVTRKETFGRKLNLRELPAGSYSLEIKNDIGTLTYPIQLSGQELSIPVDERIATFNPIIRKTNNTVSLVLFSPAKHSHQLSIYNERHELVHGENIEETVSFTKQFDFSEALPGSYSIVINSQGHRYTYMVPVK